MTPSDSAIPPPAATVPRAALPAMTGVRLAQTFLSSPRLGTSAWLLRLRWMAVAGQLVTIAAASLLVDSVLPIAPLLALVGLTAITNTAYSIWLRRRSPGAAAQAGQWSDVDGQAHWVAASLMTLDLGTLTAMLYFSGGASNPFSFFYFVNLAVGGVILRPRFAWVLAALAILGYSLLLRYYIPIGVQGFAPLPVPSIHTAALFVAFATCASVVTHFVTRTAGELTRHQRQLQLAQEERARGQQLEGLTTLAAGAAHELATPLSTIDVIARELGRHLEDWQTPQSIKDDLALIDGQLELCRQILSRMRSAAGDQAAHRWDRTTVGDLIDATLEGVRDPHRVDVVDGPEEVEQQSLWLPQEAVAQAIRNLVHNGLDAGQQDGRVRLAAKLLPGNVVLEITDSGQGMSDEVLERIGQPFFTTKEPGRGMGLGLFLARNVISRLGGQLEFTSRPGEGTTATVRLPIDGAPAASAANFG